MKWIRWRILAPVPLTADFSRYYVDAIRSDGREFRAGVDIRNGSKTLEQIGDDLEQHLDSFLPCTHICQTQVGVDCHKGEEGWREL
jgi:hypothetical protein